ncbi:MAG: glycoside hydrolase family 2 TIM barrel-domain containing protein [Lachnospiraceae bacterium]|nr:glycoside hydrolase family 2 TIM barrel-domain containing protein [Lachnospiraceae bacterium]
MRKHKQAGLYSLNRDWRFIEERIPVIPKGISHDEVYGYSKAGSAKGPAAADFDDEDWERVNLPHDWLVKKPYAEDAIMSAGYKHRGCGWYRKKFQLEEQDRGKQLLLEFEGLSSESAVYVNGMLLKRSSSGYNSFCIDMTDVANYGIVPNQLSVWIDASQWEGWWYEGAGIYRNVWLIKKPQAHVTYHGVFARTRRLTEGAELDASRVNSQMDPWELLLDTELENCPGGSCSGILKHVLYDEKGQVTAQTEQEFRLDGYAVCTLQCSLPVLNPRLWDTAHPHLYTLRTSCITEQGEDRIETEVGFRTIALTPDRGFFLNGNAVKFKGFCNHQDAAGVGVAVPYSVKEYRIRKLKDLGANAYRSAHNPDPDILTICDRLGMMVMEENRTFSTAEYNLEDVRGIAKNARNHPSVVLYSVFNEEPLQGTEKGGRLAARLRAAIRDVDATRPVTGAMNGGYLEEQGAASVMDAVGINYNPTRYDEFHERFPEVPLIGSETASAFMVRGEYENRPERNVLADYDTECAAWGNTAAEAWKYIEERPFVAGGFVWTGFDYRGEPTPFKWPSIGTCFGTYDSCGFEKNACYIYKALWKPEPMIHISSPWRSNPKEGEVVKVSLITNCEEGELFVNGRSLGRYKAERFTQQNYELPYEGGVLRAVGYNHGNAAAEDVQKSAGEPAQILTELSRDVLYADGADAVVINVTLADEAGTVLEASDARAAFEVKGVKILGVGNGNPVSHEPDFAAERSLFHGRVQLTVQCEEIAESRGSDVKQKPDYVFDAVEVEDMRTEGAEILIRIGELEKTLILPIAVREHPSYIESVNERIVGHWTFYKKLLDEMPEVSAGSEENDMNSFEPVEPAWRPQPEFSGALGKYGHYRTQFDFGAAKQGRKLYFREVLGHAYVYIDGEEIYRREDSFGGEFFAEIPEAVSGEHMLTVVIYNGNAGYPEAGICSPVGYYQ